MNEAIEVLTQDLHILKAMTAEMKAYLDSEATYWPLNQEGMPPKLTIGGCLMRQSRLCVLQDRLLAVDCNQLYEVIEAFNELLRENVVRFEARAHDELHARLREWTTYLRNATSQVAREHYASTVDTRLVITALVDKLQMPPYELNPQVAEDVNHIDNHLKGRWQPGEFVLPEVWRAAYPKAKYWWLYGGLES